MKTIPLPHFLIQWTSTKVEDFTIHHEPAGKQNVISLKDWDKIVDTYHIVTPTWLDAGDEVSREDWQDYLKGKQFDDEVELDFDVNNNFENSFTTIAELDGFDQWPLIVTLDRTNSFWILASYENIENSGFIFHGLIPNNNFLITEAFPILMYAFFKYYLNQGKAGLEEDRIDDFTIIEEIEPGMYNDAVEFYLKNKLATN